MADGLFSGVAPTPQQQEWGSVFSGLVNEVSGAPVAAGKTWFWRQVIAWLRWHEPWAFEGGSREPSGAEVWLGEVVGADFSERDDHRAVVSIAVPDTVAVGHCRVKVVVEGPVR